MYKLKDNKHHTALLALSWIMLSVIGRIMPHINNVTPITALALCAGLFFKRWHALVVVLLSLIISDVAVAYSYGYAMFGSWSLFSYSGFLLIALAGSLPSRLPKLNLLLCFSLSSTLGYWIWTNFGTWVATNIYPHTVAGLGACLTAGLPFLRHSAFGDTLWVTAIYCIVTLCLHRKGSSQVTA